MGNGLGDGGGRAIVVDYVHVDIEEEGKTRRGRYRRCMHHALPVHTRTHIFELWNRLRKQKH
jgi:hypothetical protein